MIISSKKKIEIRALEIVSSADYEHFFDILEGDLSHSQGLAGRHITSNIKEQRVQADRIIKAAEVLLALLEDPSAATIKSSASNRVASLSGESNYRWNDQIASQCVSAIYKEAIAKREDLGISVGTRYREQQLLDIINFWNDYMKLSIRPITRDGKFVRLCSILMSQNVEASCRAIQRLLEKRPDIEQTPSSTTKRAKNSPELS